AGRRPEQLHVGGDAGGRPRARGRAGRRRAGAAALPARELAARGRRRDGAGPRGGGLGRRRGARVSAPVHGLDPRWARAAAELMRALRGPRSQVAFARRLGLRSNAPAAWEGGHRVPAAGALIAALGRLGVDAAAAWARFHPPAAAAFADGGLAAWLRALRGQAAVDELAARSGLSET
ncbi:MAG: hypothetical protein ACK56I_25090, partial [bacterium]